MTAETLSLVAGVVLSLLFSYVPKLNTWYAALDGVNKRLIMLAVLLVTSVVIYGQACIGWLGMWDVNVTCDTAGIQELIKAFILAMIANQSAYAVTPLPAKVRAIQR